MSMKPSALLVLALVGAAVAVAVWLDRGRPTTDERRVEHAQLAPGFDAARADVIELERDGKRVRVEKRNGAWWLGPTRADDAAVEAIVSTLQYAQVERRAPIALPSARATLTAGGITLRIGGDAPGRGVYVERLGEVVVAEPRLLEVVEAELASARLTVGDPAGARTLAFAPLSLERQAGGWRIVQPSPARADGDRVDALLAALARARAASTVTPGPAPLPGDRALVLDGKTEARLRDGGCRDQVLALRADGAALCFDRAALSPLFEPGELRDPHPFPFRLDEVDALDVREGAATLSLRRAEHAWRITAPLDAAGPADDGAVREWLDALVHARARRFAAPGRALATVRMAAGGDEVSVEIGRTDTELTALRRGEAEAGYLPSSTLKLIDTDPLRVRSRRIDTFRPADVTALSVDGVELRRPFSEAARRAIEAFSDLRASQLIRRQFPTTRTLTARVAGVPHTLELGLSDADGCLARENGLAFVLPPATCAALTADLRK
jgi:hypothetical protein